MSKSKTTALQFQCYKTSNVHLKTAYPAFRIFERPADFCKVLYSSVHAAVGNFLNLKEDLTVELVLMHRYGKFTIFKICQSDFRATQTKWQVASTCRPAKKNTLISDDYINNNHPVSTLSDAAKHLAGKKLFCKLGCSQAYHCLQMADQRSFEMLAFNFASRTFAYKRLAQGLSKALSTFSTFRPY